MDLMWEEVAFAAALHFKLTKEKWYLVDKSPRKPRKIDIIDIILLYKYENIPSLCSVDESLYLYLLVCWRSSVHKFVSSSGQESCTNLFEVWESHLSFFIIISLKNLTELNREVIGHENWRKAEYCRIRSIQISTSFHVHLPDRFNEGSFGGYSSNNTSRRTTESQCWFILHGGCGGCQVSSPHA